MSVVHVCIHSLFHNFSELLWAAWNAKTRLGEQKQDLGPARYLVHM